MACKSLNLVYDDYLRRHDFSQETHWQNKHGDSNKSVLLLKQLWNWSFCPFAIHTKCFPPNRSTPAADFKFATVCAVSGYVTWLDLMPGIKDGDTVHLKFEVWGRAGWLKVSGSRIKSSFIGSSVCFSNRSDFFFCRLWCEWQISQGHAPIKCGNYKPGCNDHVWV